MMILDSDVGEHWYTREGEPCYEVRAASGLPRPTTLADGRKLGLVPSVTTVLSVMAKPALETWKVRQGILAALTLTRAEDEPDDSYLARVLADSGQQAKSAAEEGTRIHDAIEQAFKGEWFPPRYQPHVDAVMERLQELYPGVTDWVCEASFAHGSGFGGKVDLHSPSTGIVIDHKGKDGDFTDGKRLHYDQHYQLAAYNRGLILPPRECVNFFVSRTHPGKVAHHVWKQTDVDKGWNVFADALRLWKSLRGFDPSFQPMDAAA